MNPKVFGSGLNSGNTDGYGCRMNDKWKVWVKNKNLKYF
jgi:hypothetical protein